MRGGPPAATLSETIEEDVMNRLMIVARLQEGKYEEAEALLRAGPPFDPDELGLHRHAAYLTASEVVFVFEAPEVEWIVSDVVDDPVLSSALEPWRHLVDGPPRIAHERFYWTREEARPGAGLGV
jgi:hypothetical protein